MCEFEKQPITPLRLSDSEAPSGSNRQDHPRQFSLLSSLLSEHSVPSKPLTPGYISAPSAPSSSPSTAFSSPRANDEPVSILRRGSLGSDGEPFQLGQGRILPIYQRTAAPDTSPKRAGVTPRLDLVGPPLVSFTLRFSWRRHAHNQSGRRPSLKFEVVQSRPVVERTPVSAQQSEGEDDEEEEESEGMDPGYEEDSEDGFSDDEPTFIVQAMTRAREARLRDAKPPAQSVSLSPPTHEVGPPSRRGRGHIRVDPAADKDHKQCTRHHSPPPSDARSTRSAPPGPRDGRAGSPVPSLHSEDFYDEDEDNEDDQIGQEGAGDPMHFAHENENENENENDDHALASDDPDSAEATGISVVESGVRNILRRASEHLPTFSRPSFTPTSPADPRAIAKTDTDNARTPLTRARSLSARAANSPLHMAPLRTDDSLVRSPPMTCPGRCPDVG